MFDQNQTVSTWLSECREQITTMIIFFCIKNSTNKTEGWLVCIQSFLITFEKTFIFFILWLVKNNKKKCKYKKESCLKIQI